MGKNRDSQIEIRDEKKMMMQEVIFSSDGDEDDELIDRYFDIFFLSLSSSFTCDPHSYAFRVYLESIHC